jgi:AraC family transcriptional regulator of adaptative response/methylated-DNA-[protein]-cysteine methyltransferase
MQLTSTALANNFGPEAGLPCGSDLVKSEIRNSVRSKKSLKSKSPATEVIRYGFGHSSAASILVALSDKGVVAILIREHPGDEAFVVTLRARFPRAKLQHDRAATRESIEAVVAFVERPTANLMLPLDIRGTDFQRRVWTAVRKIPFAETTVFAEIARRIDAPRAVRAVGNACALNPLEFAIPCHRVMRSDGSYSGGSTWGDLRQSTIVRREADWHFAHSSGHPSDER